MMPGWNHMGQPGFNNNYQANQVMGAYSMDGNNHVGSRQMMYQQPFMQQPMYQQSTMNQYPGNMNNHPRMMAAQSNIQTGVSPQNHPLLPSQPPPPTPSEPPPPLPNDENKSIRKPPLPDSAEKWWVSELMKLKGRGHLEEELKRLTKANWFLGMSTSQQIECWQHKIQLRAKQDGSKGDAASEKTASPQHSAPDVSDVQTLSDSFKPTEMNTTFTDQKLTTDDWDQHSGENPHEALKRYQEDLSKLQKQGEQFEVQYNNWRKQFDEWKRKHENHPNKTQFIQYEKQWMTWQEQMTTQKKQNDANIIRHMTNINKIQATITELNKPETVHQQSDSMPSQMHSQLSNYPQQGRDGQGRNIVNRQHQLVPNMSDSNFRPRFGNHQSGVSEPHPRATRPNMNNQQQSGRDGSNHDMHWGSEDGNHQQRLWESNNQGSYDDGSQNTWGGEDDTFYDENDQGNWEQDDSNYYPHHHQQQWNDPDVQRQAHPQQPLLSTPRQNKPSAYDTRGKPNMPGTHISRPMRPRMPIDRGQRMVANMRGGQNVRPMLPRGQNSSGGDHDTHDDDETGLENDYDFYHQHDAHNQQGWDNENPNADADNSLKEAENYNRHDQYSGQVRPRGPHAAWLRPRIPTAGGLRQRGPHPNRFRQPHDPAFSKRPRLSQPGHEDYDESWEGENDQDYSEFGPRSTMRPKMICPTRPLLRPRIPGQTSSPLLGNRPHSSMQQHGGLRPRFRQRPPRPSMKIDTFGDSCVVIDDEGDVELEGDNESYYDHNNAKEEQFGARPRATGSKPLLPTPGNAGQQEVRLRNPGASSRPLRPSEFSHSRSAVAEDGDWSNHSSSTLNKLYLQRKDDNEGSAHQSFAAQHLQGSNLESLPKGESTAPNLAKSNINLNTARDLVAANPLFSGENMKKLQEQLKAIQHANKSKQAADAFRVQDQSTLGSMPHDSKQMTQSQTGVKSDAILEKAKAISSIDLKNILSAVKSATSSHAENKEGEGSSQKNDPLSNKRGSVSEQQDLNRRMLGVDRQVSGSALTLGQGDAALRRGIAPLLDPLGLDSRETFNSYRDDVLLREFLKVDPALERELLFRELQERELLEEARRIDPSYGLPFDPLHADRERIERGLRLNEATDWRVGNLKKLISSDRHEGLHDVVGKDRVLGDFSRGDMSEREYRDKIAFERQRLLGGKLYDTHGSRGRSPLRDLRDTNQQDLERESIERRHEALNRELEILKRRREMLTAEQHPTEIKEERDQREQSLERLHAREKELRKREDDIIARERALRVALHRQSSGRKDGLDDGMPPPLSREHPGFQRRSRSRDRDMPVDDRGPPPRRYSSQRDGRESPHGFKYSHDPNFPRMDYEYPPRDQKFPPHDHEFSLRDREFPPRDRDFPPRDREFSSRDREFPPREREFPPREREFPLRDREIPLRDREIPPRDRDFPHRDREFSSRDRDFPPRDREIPPRDREFPPRDRDFPPRDRDFPPRDREFPPRDNRRRSLSPKRDRGSSHERRLEDLERRSRGRERGSPKRRPSPRRYHRSRSRSPVRSGTGKDRFGRDIPLRSGHVDDKTQRGRPSGREKIHEEKMKVHGDLKNTPSRVNTPPPHQTGLKPMGRPLKFSDIQGTPPIHPLQPVGPLNVNVEDVINKPGRLKRPSKIVVILRGLPGCGKTHIAKAIRDKENLFGVSPRVLGLDDYFMSEVEKTLKDPDTGKNVKKKVFEYEYEAEMEPSYRGNLIRSFKKTLEDGYFTFIIMDAVNDKVQHFAECYNTAKRLGFQPYVAEIKTDVHVCSRRNTHNRSLQDLQKLLSGWEDTPANMNRMDLRQMLQDSEIQEVEMGDITDSDDESKEEQIKVEEKPTSSQATTIPTSKWENDSAAARLDKLDGISKKANKQHKSMEDFLCVTDDYNSRKSAPGKKRVRWADINERQKQQRMRDVGFVVGQDWSRIMDDSHATQALNRTKFI